MSLQLMRGILPCGKPADLRVLSPGIRVGDSYSGGDVTDGTAIVEDARYVVSWNRLPADTGTGLPNRLASGAYIDYNNNQQAIGSSFLGVSGQTMFTRHAELLQAFPRCV